MGVISISRQAGSYGDEIAGIVAEKMGYKVMTREAVHKLAMNCDDSYKDACSMYENEMAKGFWDRFFFNNSANASLFESLNYEVASQGNVVMLGRGAQMVFAGLPGIIKVRVVAPADLRVQRIAKKQGLNQHEAEKYIRWYDKQRRALIESVFEHDLGDTALYDLVLNTKALSAETGAQMVLDAAKEIIGNSDQDSLGTILKARALTKKIETQVRRELIFPYQRSFEVEYVGDGTVRLMGFVSDAQSKQQAEDIAMGFEGVKEVVNDLAVTEIMY